MRYLSVVSLLFIAGCTTVSGGAPIVRDYGEGHYFVRAQTGIAPWAQEAKAEAKFETTAVKLCGKGKYVETEMETNVLDTGNPVFPSVITARFGYVTCVKSGK